MQELDSGLGIGLIEKRRRGSGKVNVIYVKSFVFAEAAETEEVKDDRIIADNGSGLQIKLLEFLKVNFKKFTFQTLIISIPTALPGKFRKFFHMIMALRKNAS